MDLEEGENTTNEWRITNNEANNIKWQTCHCEFQMTIKSISIFMNFLCEIEQIHAQCQNPHRSNKHLSIARFVIRRLWNVPKNLLRLFSIIFSFFHVHVESFVGSAWVPFMASTWCCRAMNAQFQRIEIIWHVTTIDRFLSGEFSAINCQRSKVKWHFVSFHLISLHVEYS